ASLDHPNLAKVLDGGITDDGVPYFVMELVSGQPVDTYCDAHDLSVAQRLALFRTVCQVVHYAHLRGVIHRDLKPANILVTPAGAAERRKLRGDLDAVVLMALRKDPARRYASAEQLGDDLFRHLEGLPVQARRGALGYRAGRFLLRHRAVVGAALVANLALVIGIA